MSSESYDRDYAIEAGAKYGRGSLAVVRGLIASLRPHQWVKNTLVFGGLIFSRTLTQGSHLRLSVSAFVVFCMASSSIYLLNDLCDLEADRLHPIKRFRPLAAGVISKNIARITLVVLLVTSTAAALWLGSAFATVLGCYMVLNVFYSFGMKRIVILDVMAIAMGFVLRAVAGAVVIGVVSSPWLVLCTFTLALLLGFGKRRHELNLLQHEATNHRQSLEGYSTQFLDAMMTITAGAAVVTYALYTMADETVARFGSRSLISTVPFVLYGIFRYLFLIHKRREGGDPAKLMVSDVPMLINVGLWVVVVCVALYGPKSWHPW